jgi:hemolysin III
LVLGWEAVMTLPRASHTLRPGELALLGAMGALYTGGAVVLARRRPDPVPHLFGYHEVWHAAVVVASACFYLLLWLLGG